MKKIKAEENLDRLSEVIYGYTANISHLEEENRILRESVSQFREELDRFRRSPLMVCEVREVYGNNVIIKIPNGNLFYVSKSGECDKIKAGESVLVEQRNLTIVKRIRSTRFNVEKFAILEKLDEKNGIGWHEIGGLSEQVREIKEVIELPLKSPEIFEHVGIHPPKGILLYGPPGTGKTMLAKAVATSTNATFIQIVGSEIVQKFIGEGAKLVKDIFHMAREKAPSIIFIDELDAIAAKRVEIGTSGEREVQRTFMQLLSEIDGFNNLGNVKVIACTNRKDILDPAIIRPGRLDRHIYIPIPDKAARKEILKIHTKRMSISGLDAEKIMRETEGFSGAEIKSLCTEAGYFAIRENRTNVSEEDFYNAIFKLRSREEESGKEYMGMFG